jgi:hypothetical protein
MSIDNSVAPTIQMAITLLRTYAVGETIVERFTNVIKPEHLREGCWMTTKDDEQFRAAVGAVMVSYGVGTPEFEQLQNEMKLINQFSAFIQAAMTGLNVEPPVADPTHKPLGLLGIWAQSVTQRQ